MNYMYYLVMYQKNGFRAKFVQNSLNFLSISFGKFVEYFSMFCSLLLMHPTMKNHQRLQIRQKKLKKNLIQLFSKPHLPMEIFKTQIPRALKLHH